MQYTRVSVGALDLDLQSVVGCPVPVPGTEPGSSSRAVCASAGLAIFPAPE